MFMGEVEVIEGVGGQWVLLGVVVEVWWFG